MKNHSEFSVPDCVYLRGEIPAGQKEKEKAKGKEKEKRKEREKEMERERNS